MHNFIDRLEKKGWAKKEIKKAALIIQKTKQNKTKAIVAFDRHIYWILLVVIVVANFAISLALMPLLLALNGMFLYFILILLGMVFGLLFELVIRSIEHLEKKHHLILAFLIPLIALVNILFMVNFSNRINGILNLSNSHEPILVGIVYAASFVLPYIIYRFVYKIEYYSKE